MDISDRFEDYASMFGGYDKITPPIEGGTNPQWYEIHFKDGTSEYVAVIASVLGCPSGDLVEFLTKAQRKEPDIP